MLIDRAIASSRFSNRPLYLQLRDALAERIASGKWKPSATIPNETDLAREFGVSAGTIRKALDLMEAERLLTRRQGRGTFVNDQASDELAARFSNIRGPDGTRVCGQVKSAEVTQGPANPVECTRLRLGAEDRVYRIHRLRQHKGKTFLVEDVVLPAALFPGLEDKKTSVTERIIVLAQEYGLLPGKAEERVSLSGAPPVVAQKLGVAVGSPVMVLDRTVLSLDGWPIEWRMGWCHLADRYYMAEMV